MCGSLTCLQNLETDFINSDAFVTSSSEMATANNQHNSFKSDFTFRELFDAIALDVRGLYSGKEAANRESSTSTWKFMRSLLHWDTPAFYDKQAKLQKLCNAIQHKKDVIHPKSIPELVLEAAWEHLNSIQLANKAQELVIIEEACSRASRDKYFDSTKQSIDAIQRIIDGVTEEVQEQEAKSNLPMGLETIFAEEKDLKKPEEIVMSVQPGYSKMKGYDELEKSNIIPVDYPHLLKLSNDSTVVQKEVERLINVYEFQIEQIVKELRSRVSREGNDNPVEQRSQMLKLIIDELVNLDFVALREIKPVVTMLQESRIAENNLLIINHKIQVLEKAIFTLGYLKIPKIGSEESRDHFGDEMKKHLSAIYNERIMADRFYAVKTELELIDSIKKKLVNDLYRLLSRYLPQWALGKVWSVLSAKSKMKLEIDKMDTTE